MRSLGVGISEPEIQKSVDYRFKILYALGMVLVVTGHGAYATSFLTEWFPAYSFHLGLFAFCSGYFYKPKVEETNIYIYIYKKFCRLIVPMYVYNFAYAGLILVIQRYGFMPHVNVNLKSLLIFPIIDGHQFVYNLGGWFVVPLFMVEVFQVAFRHLLTKWKTNSKEIFVFACYGVLGVCGVCLAAKGYNQFWWLTLDRMLFFLPFYGLGYFYKSVLERWDKVPNWLYFSIILCLEVVVLLHYGYIPAFTVSWCNDFITNPVVPYVVGFLGIAFWLRMAKILEPAVGKSRCVNLIADNTFSIMMNHLLGFTLVSLIYGSISTFTSYCQNFDWTAFKGNIWYRYYPKGIVQMGVVYLIAGLLFPIAIQHVLNQVKAFWKKRLKIKNFRNNS